MNGIFITNITIDSPQVRLDKPINLYQKLQFGDLVFPGFRTFQLESSVSNVHVYSRILAMDEMIKFTGEGVCAHFGDYLAWDDMKWKFNGETSLETLEKDQFCNKDHSSENTFLFTEKFSWPTCTDLCPKMEKGHIPIPTNKEEIDELMTWYYYLIQLL